MSLTTPSNTLNTFPAWGPAARTVAICHDLFERDEASSEGRIMTILPAQMEVEDPSSESGDSVLPS